MRVPRPPCTLTRSLYAPNIPKVNDVVHHRWVTHVVAQSILLDSAVVAVPAMWVMLVFCTKLGIQNNLLAPLAEFTIPAVILTWNLIWIDQNTPVLSRILWGGNVYVIKDASGRIGLTTEIGVVEHPAVSNAILAEIPGVLFFRKARIRVYKPICPNREIGWTKEAVIRALDMKPQGRPRRIRS